MKASFLSGYSNARQLRNFLAKNKVTKQKYVIERSIFLCGKDFVYLREHLLEPNKTIALYKDNMFIDKNNNLHVLMFCSITSDIMLLIYSESDYAEKVAIITNGGEQIEKRFSLNGLNKSLLKK